MKLSLLVIDDKQRSKQRTEQVHEEPLTSVRKNKTFVLALVVANLVSAFPVLITSLLLIEISQSFDIEIGVANQVRTAASTASVIMGILMGGLSVRFRHKSLFLVGMGFLCLAALCCTYAPTFMALIIAFSIYGLSRAMVRPIGHALVGRYVPLHQRPTITGYLIVGLASAYLIGAPLTNVLGDWRQMFFVFLLPLTVITWLLAYQGIPSTPKHRASSQQYRQAFKDVLFTKSAFACLLGGVLWKLPTNAVIVGLSSSFYRQTFLIDKLFMSFAVIGLSLTATIGSLVGGRLVTRVGRKRLTVISALLLGTSTLLYVNIPHLGISLTVWLIGGFFIGSVNTAYASLALEQVPNFRGTMMSLSEVAMFAAQALGNAFAGFLLLVFSYEVVSLTGVFSIGAAVIFNFCTRDPTQYQQVNPELRGAERL